MNSCIIPRPSIIGPNLGKHIYMKSTPNFPFQIHDQTNSHKENNLG